MREVEKIHFTEEEMCLVQELSALCEPDEIFEDRFKSFFGRDFSFEFISELRNQLTDTTHGRN